MSIFSIFNSNWGCNGLICWAMSLPCGVLCALNHSPMQIHLLLRKSSMQRCYCTNWAMAEYNSGSLVTLPIWKWKTKQRATGLETDFLHLIETQQYIPNLCHPFQSEPQEKRLGRSDRFWVAYFNIITQLSNYYENSIIKLMLKFLFNLPVFELSKLWAVYSLNLFFIVKTLKVGPTHFYFISLGSHWAEKLQIKVKN